MSDALRASFRLHGALESLRAQDLRASTQAQIFERGAAYHRRGRVRGINLQGTRLNAWVDGSRSRPYLVECVDRGNGRLRATCSCPYAQDWRLPCKHLVATLLAWITQRRHIRRGTVLTTYGGSAQPPMLSSPPPVKQRAAGLHGASLHKPPAATPPQGPITHTRLRPFPRSLPPWMATRLELSERGLLSGPQLSLPMAWMFVTEFFSGAGMLRGEVTVSEDTTTLEVAVRAEQTGLQARYRIPREEIPNFVAHCRRASDLKWVGPASELALRRQPVSPCLVANFDEAGRLVLEPGCASPERTPGGCTLLSAQEFEAGRVGDQWFWGRHGLYPIAPVPRRLRPYFSGETPLVYEGMRIPEFLAGAYHRLLQEIAFRPSEAVRQARILPPPVVGHVKLDVDGPDWLWCDLRYVSGDHWLALRELLEAQAKGPYVRRGRDWIRLPGPAELADVQEHPQHKRADAGRCDDAHRQPHDERPDRPRSGDSQPAGEQRRDSQLEQPAEAQAQRDHDGGDEDRNPWLLECRAQHASGQAGDEPQNRVGDRQPQHVASGQRRGAAHPLLCLPGEEAQRDRNQRVNTRGQIEGQAAHERQHETAGCDRLSPLSPG